MDQSHQPPVTLTSSLAVVCDSITTGLFIGLVAKGDIICGERLLCPVGCIIRLNEPITSWDPAKPTVTRHCAGRGLTE